LSNLTPLLPAILIFGLTSTALLAADHYLTPKHRGLGAVIVAAAILLFVAQGFYFFSSAGTDDPHITYWAAYLFAETGQILNLNYEPVEQSSSLVHVVLLGTLYKIFGGNLVVLGKLFSIAVGALTVWVTWLIARSYCRQLPASAAVIASVSTFLVYWAFGGLETTLAALLLLLVCHSVWLCLQGLRPALLGYNALAVLLFVGTRPEAVFVVLAAYITMLIYFGLTLRPSTHSTLKFKPLANRILTLMAVCAAVFLLLAGLRYSLFGEIFPQPVSAKSSGLSMRKIRIGTEYLLTNLALSPALTLLIITGLVVALREVFRRSYDNRTILLTGILIAAIDATFSFIVFGGGDWMEGGRFLVPVIPLITLLAVNEISRMSSKTLPVLAVIAVLAVIDSASFTRTDSKGMLLPDAMATEQAVRSAHGIEDHRFSWFEYANKENLRDIPFLLAADDILGRAVATGDDVSVISIQMGMVPYHLARKFGGQVEFIDLMALATAHFTECEATKNFPTIPAGLLLSYRVLLADDGQLFKACGMRRPEIIIDLTVESGVRREIIANSGYEIVYFQDGLIVPPSGGAEFSGGELIAVRKDFLKKLAGVEPVVYQWPPIADMAD